MLVSCIVEGQLEQAVAYSRSLIEQCSDYPEVYLELGELWLQYHHPEIAIPYFQKALQSWPETISFYEDFLKQLIATGDLDTVINLAIHLLCVRPDWLAGFLAIGYCLQQKGRQDEAASCISMKLLSAQVIEEFCCPRLDWSVAHDLALEGVSSVQVYPSELYRFPSDHIKRVNEQNFSNFSHGFASEPARIIIVENGYLWLDTYTRAIFTSDHNLIVSASSGNVALVAASQYLPTPLIYDERIACLGTRYAYSYFHWLFDVVPKLGLLQKSEDLKGIQKFIFNKNYERFQYEVFELLELPLNRLLFTNKIYAKCSVLFVPLFSFNQGHVSQPVCNYLRSAFINKVGKNDTSYPKRFYISRHKASHRRLLNEADIIEILDRFGFQVIRPEELSFTEQVEIFKQATAIVAPHGAGLANIVFCQPNTKVIELFANEVLNYYWIISNHVGLDYYYLKGELAKDVSPIVTQEAGFSIPTAPLDFTVSPTSLLSVLEMARLT